MPITELKRTETVEVIHRFSIGDWVTWGSGVSVYLVEDIFMDESEGPSYKLTQFLAEAKVIHRSIVPESILTFDGWVWGDEVEPFSDEHLRVAPQWRGFWNLSPGTIVRSPLTGAVYTIAGRALTRMGTPLYVMSDGDQGSVDLFNTFEVLNDLSGLDSLVQFISNIPDEQKNNILLDLAVCLQANEVNTSSGRPVRWLSLKEAGLLERLGIQF